MNRADIKKQFIELYGGTEDDLRVFAASDGLLSACITV